MRTVALTLSVLINLFLAAVIGGHYLRAHLNRFPEPEDNTLVARQLARVESVLPARDAAAFRHVIERDKPLFVRAARQLQAARRSLERQIAANPFDRQAATEALTTYRMSWDRFVGDFGGPLIDALAQVSPRGRRALVAARRKARERLLSRLPSR